MGIQQSLVIEINNKEQSKDKYAISNVVNGCIVIRVE